MKDAVAAIIRTIRPSSTLAIQKLLKDRGITCSNEEIIRIVEELDTEGDVVAYLLPITWKSFVSYLADIYSSWWMYGIIAASLVETILVLFEPYRGILLPVRFLLGFGVLGFLPGYSSQRALFPERALTFLERLLLSIFLSVVISISLGIILGSVFLFRAGPNASILSLYITIVTIIAAYRSYKSARFVVSPN